MFKMSEADLELTEARKPSGILHIEDKEREAITVSAAPSTKPLVAPIVPRVLERSGTIEHLAARRPISELDATTPALKQRLSEFRTEVTRLVTGLRWRSESVEDTAKRMIPLLNVGSVRQWKSILIPFLLEIDRAGNLVPVWLKIIEQVEQHDLPPDTNPAETEVGRARRFAILMLGNYKSFNLSEQSKHVGFARSGSTTNAMKYQEITKLLEKLATAPDTSLYATEALVKQSTTAAIQALVSGLKDAEGWAKVDIVEGCLALQQARFYELLLASGLDGASGLESYIAIPIYRAIPLESYLRGGNDIAPRLSQQAVLLVGQIVQESMTLPRAGSNDLPILFERNLPNVANALFEGARSTPSWHYTLAVHRLGIVLGRYWHAISEGSLQDTRILEPIYACLPMMPDVEHWMTEVGRDILLNTLVDGEVESFMPTVKALGELREARAASALLSHLEAIQELQSREQALVLSAVCDTLACLEDCNAVSPMLQLVSRVVHIDKRTTLPKRRTDLPVGDSEIPGSIIYAAVVRACGQLGDALGDVLRATGDFDPYVRLQAIEAIKRLDPVGEDEGSLAAMREALKDPRDTVVRAACQLALQYRDDDSITLLRSISETRPELAPAAYNTLRQLEQQPTTP